MLYAFEFVFGYVRLFHLKFIYYIQFEKNMFFIDIIIKIYLGASHVSTENDGSNQVRASTRYCRHMGPVEKSDACGICKLVCFILIF